MAARHFCWKPGKNGRVGVKGPEGSIKNTISVIWEQSKPVHSMHHWLWLKNMPPSNGSQPQASSLYHPANTRSQRRLHSQEDLLPNKNTALVWKHRLTWCKFFHNVWRSTWSFNTLFRSKTWRWLWHWILCHCSTLAVVFDLKSLRTYFLNQVGKCLDPVWAGYFLLKLKQFRSGICSLICLRATFAKCQKARGQLMNQIKWINIKFIFKLTDLLTYYLN